MTSADGSAKPAENSGSSDPLRAELAEALGGTWGTANGVLHNVPSDLADLLASALIPIVNRHTRAARADELDRIYQVIDNECQDAPAPNYAEDDFDAGYIAGLTFAQDFIGTPAKRATIRTEQEGLDVSTGPNSSSETADGRLLEYNGRPTGITEALTEIAAWLDTADKFVDEAFRIRGKTRPNAGDDVQRDLRHLADWFGMNPDAAASAARHLRDVTW